MYNDIYNPTNKYVYHLSHSSLMCDENTKDLLLGYRDSSVVKSTYCFSRGPQVQFTCWLTTWCNFDIGESDAFFWPPWA